MQYPINGFLFAYLVARDAVGANCTEALAKQNPNLALSGELASQLEEFWLIVGLMESGHVREAFDRIKKFKPSEPLPLLSLHLGAFLIEHIRSGTKAQKQSANQIAGYLLPTVGPLIKKYLKEFKTKLIEIQTGEIKALPLESEEPVLL